MPTPKEKFQGLLRELFQFSSADLDFGIYRIMNFKRDIIERFIQKDLIEAVNKELSSGMLASQSKAALELEEKAAQIRETLGETALNGDGNLVEEFHNTKVGREYLDLQSRASEAQESPAFEATIFNHLYAFFCRYYDSGDFLSKRRYSRREKYAIPYNGEEVYLHWANSDQYYVKTGECFNDYRFKSPYGISVHFKLVAADVEKDNVKGDKRFFMPLSRDVVFNAEKKEITISFQYRPLTEQEEIKYGQRNQQDAIIKEALDTIPAELQKEVDALPALVSTHHTASNGQQVNYLEHHLRQYTRRNTSDFFVHKDLKVFLMRELDFYLKNEVLNLDEMEVGGEAHSEAWFQIMRVIRSIGSRVVEFLAQIEDFQKRLFEKRKFVLETQYCITMANVPEDFYPEIAECEAQWQEWKELLHLDEEQPNLFTSAARNQKERRIATLKEHPTLVLDTKHFDWQFKDQLLASYDSLDELTDGLLFHGENFQALNLLQGKYREKVKCIHIDPPYNTEVSGFLYKNDYKHSSWLSMMDDRISASMPMLQGDGNFLCHIDENEYERLYALIERYFNNVNTGVWDKLNPMMGAQELAMQHEYILFCTNEPKPFMVRPENVRLILSLADSAIRKHGCASEQACAEFSEAVRKAPGLSGGERAYHCLDNEGYVYRLAAMGWPNPKPPPPQFFEPLIHTITGKPCPVPARGWSQSPESMKKLIQSGLIIFGPDETTQPQKKVYLSDEKALSSIIRNGSRGKNDLQQLGFDFDYSHPVSLYVTLLDAGLGSEANTIVADYFAGSGTTAHAVINLNREDGGNRRFILVEMEEYFDTVLLPRIKKVIYTPEWKDGKPKRASTTEEAERSPRIIKYICLERYEDTLNNITFPDVPKTLYDFDDYLLKYMLSWETKENETLLNIEKLASPFCYKLTITGGEEAQEKQVDIPETFAYLLGLNVKTRRVYQDEERYYLVYRGNIDHREITVIWRETSGWEKEDYEKDKQFIEAKKLTEGTDKIFVNGESFIPKARTLESVFKSRMFGSL
ncbi:MAG: DNA methyltransferase [Dehalococcoidales bacterium]|nr:DNA methyltransferase [Dehalococcoidales bacterium]